MKIVIAGAGRVGRRLAKELLTHDHDIVIIEKDKQSAEDLADSYDLTVLTGDVTDVALLQQSEPAKSDLFIAVTESDETNLIASMLAKALGAPKRIARIRNEEWFEKAGLDKESAGLDQIIHPERETVEYVDSILKLDSVFDYSVFSSGQAVLLGVQISETLPVVGMTLGELREKFGLSYFVVIGILRGENSFVPHGRDTIEAGDRLWLLTAPDAAPLVLSAFRKGKKEGQTRAIIAGASRIGKRIAERLSKRCDFVTLIESDEDAARQAAEELPDVRVMKVDVIENPEALSDFDVDKLDYFVAASGKSRRNLLVSLLAKQLGAGRVVAITDESGYIPVMTAIGLDVFANPHMLAADAILSSLHEGISHYVTQLMGSHIEIAEYEIEENSPAVGKSIVDLALPQGCIIGLQIGEKEASIPDGSSIINSGDRLVIVAEGALHEEIGKKFTPRRSLFGR